MALSVFLVEDNPNIRDSLIPALSNLGAARVAATAESEDEATRSPCKAAGANAVLDKSTELEEFFDYCLEGGPLASRALVGSKE